MYLCAYPFLAGRPDPSAVVLDNLLYDRKPDTASTLRGVPGRVCPVEPVENVGQIFGRNAFSIILNLNLDKISHILDADIDNSALLVNILH